MNLNKENVKKILGIITFTLVLLALLDRKSTRLNSSH